MANRSRKHHYLPQVLQKPFCDEDGKLWYSERNSQGTFKNPEHRNRASAFRRRDLYTVLDHAGNLSDVVEREPYGALDDYLGWLLPQLLTLIAYGQPPLITGDALEDLQNAILMLLKRTPEFSRSAFKLSDTEIGKGYHESGVNKWTQRPGENEQALSYYSSVAATEQSLRHHGRNLRVRAALGITSEERKILKDFRASWALSDGTGFFILGSRICHRVGNGGGNGLRNLLLELWMPISPMVCLVMHRSNACHTTVLSKSDIEAFNMDFLRSCESVASCDHNHLVGLLEALSEV